MKTKRILTNETVLIAPTVGIELGGSRKVQPQSLPHQEKGWRMRRILKGLFASLILVLLYLSLATATQAQVSTSSCVRTGEDSPQEWRDSSDIIMERVDYVRRTPTTSSDLRANEDSDHPDTYYVRLSGWLYYANNTIKNAPIVIYNHGYSQSRGEPCAIAEFFVNQGFVVFAPLRRGHFAETPDPKPAGWQKISSTGVHIAEYVADCQTAPCPGVLQCNGNPTPATFDNAFEIDYLRQQVVDVADQIKFILQRPAIGTGVSGKKLADPKRIALLGHSYGAGLTLFANAKLQDYNAPYSVAISISAGEKSWGDDQPFWESEPSCAVANSQRPVYFLQPKNGLSLKPTKTFFGVALENRHRSQAAIFPPAPIDPNSSLSAAKQAHTNFVAYRSQVATWGPSVVEFIERYPLPSPSPTPH